MSVDMIAETGGSHQEQVPFAVWIVSDFIAKALHRSWNIVARLLAYNVLYYLTTIAVTFRSASCLCNISLHCACCNSSPCLEGVY